MMYSATDAGERGEGTPMATDVVVGSCRVVLGLSRREVMMHEAHGFTFSDRVQEVHVAIATVEWRSLHLGTQTTSSLVMTPA